jgi:hypothetical protein
MKWTIRKTSDGYIVKFNTDNESLLFRTRALALAYINNRVLSSMGL